MRYMTLIQTSIKLKLKNYTTLFMMTLFPIFLTAMFSFVFTEAYQQNGASFEVHDTEAEAIEALILERLTRDPTLVVEEVPLDRVMQTSAVVFENNADVITDMVIAMLLFALLLGGQYGIEQAIYLREPIGKRLMVAPVGKWSVYMSEVAACWLTTFGVAVLVTIAYEVLFKIGLSKNIGGTLSVMVILTLMANFVGVGIGCLVKSKNMAENIYSFLMLAMIMLSGGLIPQVDVGKIAYLSPINACNQVLHQIISTGRVESVGYLMGTGVLALLIGIGAITLSMVKGGTCSHVDSH